MISMNLSVDIKIVVPIKHWYLVRMSSLENPSDYPSYHYWFRTILTILILRWCCLGMKVLAWHIWNWKQNVVKHPYPTNIKENEMSTVGQPNSIYECNLSMDHIWPISTLHMGSTWGVHPLDGECADILNWT